MKRSREHEDLDSDAPGGDTHGPESEQTLQRVAKVVELDPEDEPTAAATMKCSLPPHKETLSFASYDEWETHFNKTHMNRCHECRKNFPSAHLLDVHIEECHDSFVAVKRDRGEHTFTCFVEGCERKCRTHQKRRMHLIDKHMYPKNFFFAVTKEGIDGRRSLLIESGHHRRRSSNNFASTKEQRRRSSILEATATATASQPVAKGNAVKGKAEEDVESTSSSDEDDERRDREDTVDSDMAELTGAMSSLQFVPPSIRFGRGGRAGFSKR